MILESDFLHKCRQGAFDVAVVYSTSACHMALVHAAAIPFIYYDHSGIISSAKCYSVKASFELISFTGVSDETLAVAGYPFEPGRYPSSTSRYPLRMTMMERVWNTVAMLQEYALVHTTPTNWLTMLVNRALSNRRYNEMDAPITKLFQVGDK